MDGAEVFSQIAGAPGQPAALKFDLPVTLQIGSRVDFAATPGPGSNIDYDDLTCTAQITAR